MICNLNISSTFTGLIILLPVIIFLVAEMIVLRLPMKKPNFGFKQTSIQISLANGGTYLIGLDVVILSAIGADTAIFYYSIAKRIANTTGIFGAMMSIESLYLSSLNTKENVSIEKRINKGYAVQFSISLLSVVSLPLYLPYISNRSNSMTGLLIVGSNLLFASIGYYSSNYNSILLGRERYGTTIITTFLSTLVYLFWIFLATKYVSVTTVISCALALKLLSEIALQRTFMRSGSKTASKSGEE
jgi:hypothetical protein